MPKLIDHESRREEIAAAAWRVIVRDGVAGASVRTVAAEAGLSVGSLRHVFASQSQLLAFAMRLVIDRAGERVRALPRAQTPLKSAEAIAGELLPLDEDRRLEMEVYLALFSASGSDPNLQETKQDAWKRVRTTCRIIIDQAVGAEANDPAANPGPAEHTDRTVRIETEVILLHAVIDGLASHLVWQPAELKPHDARRALIEHLHQMQARLSESSVGIPEVPHRTGDATMTQPTALQPTAVVFDLGNVLIGWDQTGPLADRMTLDEWNDFAAEADFGMLNTLADRGVPITEVIAQAAESDTRHGEIVAAYYDRFDLSLTGPVQGMAELVAELKASDVRLLGLSNWSAETFHHAPKVAPAINELEDIVVSGREKLIKPDPEIFHLLSRRFDLVPEQTVFVDDLPANIAAAEQLGFIGLLFTDARQLRDDLTGLGLLASPATVEN